MSTIISNPFLIADTDATSYINAVGASNLSYAEINAIIHLVRSLKKENLWDRMDAIYPLCIGNTSTIQKWNLKDPRDLDAAFRLTFNGSGTHTKYGYVSNGSTGYANTHWVPGTHGTYSDFSWGMYTWGYPELGASTHAVGCEETGSEGVILVPTGANNNVTSYIGSTANSISASSSGNTVEGVVIASQSGSTTGKLFADVYPGLGSFEQIGSTNTNDNSTAFSNITNPIALGAKTNNGSFSQYLRQYTSFAFIGGSLSDVEATTMRNLIVTFHEAINRARYYIVANSAKYYSYDINAVPQTGSFFNSISGNNTTISSVADSNLGYGDYCVQIVPSAEAANQYATYYFGSGPAGSTVTADISVWQNDASSLRISWYDTVNGFTDITAGTNHSSWTEYVGEQYTVNAGASTCGIYFRWVTTVPTTAQARIKIKLTF